MNLADRIHSRAIELGFDLVGIAPAGVAPHARAYANWIAYGMMGEMAYLARDPDRRSDLRRVLPNAQSVIIAGLNYYTIDLPDEVKNDPARGLIARYAWGIDYHNVMKPRLEDLAQFVREESRGTGIGMPVATKVYVDTGPVLERDWALAAGLGFIGKNTCLINPLMGSWLFLGAIITDADLTLTPSPSPWKEEGVSCGTCTRCLTACPTGAFPAPYVLDARKCISYLTIELKGSIPVELRPLMGNHIFGCDVCQDVCPWPMRFAVPTKERAFFPVDIDRAAPKLIDLAQLSEEGFKQRFAGTPLLRTKRRGLLRNVAVALGNWGSSEAHAALELLAHDPDPIISEHAQWGLQYNHFLLGG
ncbi:MAG TPA: tRNA epoxyqueuosine(34) reductase QueG [Anaerolineae bacterium]|nr:tRNA epoxyqueuosine(34) reductase QueG [Anaerolineae bacterium]